ncbi:MAG: type II toxin-antitoxin system prevent-host-death family antitoxin [Proteobacteria bacterium]|nr:type II toxin-antitoxin system prevent-host-death family antitoxin [Pseudomonadota bacterium]MBS0552627.1 type II toxin-antitoxin system prevent-host-death family antitoxin [Pseudomonadota bacterium]
MKSIAVFEAKNRLSELLAIVEHGEEVSITRRGVAVARLVAVDAQGDAGDRRRQSVQETFAELRKLRESIELDGNLKQLAREGLA